MNSKLLGLVLIGWGVLTAGTGNAADPVDPEELRPGLIATHSDLAGLTPNSVTLLEPTIALNLKAGESTHPRLSAAGITIRWKGYLNVLRKGTYRFKARLRGTFVLRLGGKEVMRADSRAAEPALVGGPEVELPGEVLALEAEFTRHPGDARLEIFWSGPGFHREPLPHSVLGHLPPEKPDALREHARQEYGRFLAEEHNCLSCHRPGADHLMAKTLVDRPAPDLSRIGERAFPGWIDRWLADPQKLQPHATMPKLFADDERGRAERYAVASYLASLGGPLRPERERENRKEYAASALRGETLFATVGCAACHRQDGGKPEPNEEAASLYGLLDPTGPKSNYPLGAVGSKTRPDRLAAYLADPVAVHPSGRMPSLNLSGREARDLARHLCRQRDDAIPTDLPPAPPAAAIGPIWESLDPGADERAAFAELPEPDRWK
ncbi:MAG TPA: hypothetical protein VIL46_14295, partial [Gemmataceae bacterium]